MADTPPIEAPHDPNRIDIPFEDVMARMETEHAEERRRRILAEITVQKLQVRLAEATAVHDPPV